MNIYDFKLEDINNDIVDFSIYKNKVLLIVNVASKCGFTKQYIELEQLNLKYKDKGLIILGFPCNQFLNQEFKNNSDIIEFCSRKYNVTFKLFDKVDVKGKKQSEIYKYLINNLNGEKGVDVKWNFEKFIINKNGEIVNRFQSKITPFEIEEEIKILLS